MHVSRSCVTLNAHSTTANGFGKCCVHIWRERATHKLMLIYSTEMRGRQTRTNRPMLTSVRKMLWVCLSVCWAINMFGVVRNVCRRLSNCHTNVNASNFVLKTLSYLTISIVGDGGAARAIATSFACSMFIQFNSQRPVLSALHTGTFNLRFDQTNCLCVALNRMDRSQLSPVLNFFTHCQTNERNPEQKKN